MLVRRIRPSRACDSSIAHHCTFCKARLARPFSSSANAYQNDGSNPSPSDSSVSKSPSIRTGVRRQRAAEAFKSIKDLQTPNQPVGLRGGSFRSNQAPQLSATSDETTPFKINRVYSSGNTGIQDKDPQGATRPPVRARTFSRNQGPKTTVANFRRPTTGTSMRAAGPRAPRSRASYRPRDGDDSNAGDPGRRSEAGDTDLDKASYMKKFWAAPHQYDPVPAMQESLLKAGLITRPEFAPLALEQDSLVTNRIATAAGADGLRTEMVKAMARLARRPDLTWTVDADLARRLNHGELMKFGSDEERERVTRKAELFAARTAAKISRRKGIEVEKEDVGFVPVRGETREKIVDKVLKGRYELEQRGDELIGKDATINQIKASLKMNGTYTPGKANTVLDMVSKMWPQAPAARSSSGRPATKR